MSPLDQAKQLFKNGDAAGALGVLDEARKKESSPPLWQLMAEIFFALRQDGAFEAVLREGLKNHPNDPALLVMLGTFYYRADRSQEGYELLSAQQNNPSIALTFASLARSVGKTDEAQRIFEAALVKDPSSLPALSNLAGIYLDAREYPKAIALYDKARAIDPRNGHVALQLAQAAFRSGDLAKAWKAYEARFGLIENDPYATAQRRPFPQPLWNGEKTGRLLLWAEQGAGEELLYATLLPEALSRAGKVFVECDARLAPLFQRSYPQVEFFARDNPAKDISADHQAPLGHLATLFRPNFEAFPKSIPLLKTDAAKTTALRERYKSFKKPLVIGISWRSKKLRHGDPKSAPLPLWGPLLENSPHLFVSLQHGDVAEDMAYAKQQGWNLINDLSVDQKTSLDDFAAQVAAMDAVITVSNTTAHMAGALGIKTAVLLPASRGLMGHWFDNGAECLWYPALTLLRQKTDGVWDAPLGAAKALILG